MADVVGKVINANDIHYGSATVKRHGGKTSNAFDTDLENTEVNPDGSSTTYWENKLTGRFDDPAYYDA
jgi:hypothetical protein